jgi:hypothetical protein
MEPTTSDSILNKLWFRVDGLARRHERLVVSFALAYFGLITATYAAFKPYWLDEYYSLLTENVGSPSAIWQVLKTAPMALDLPVYHILSLGIMRVAGTNEFDARLVSVLAYVVMASFFYAFVRKYSDMYTGLLAMSLTFACGTFEYASQARPYALLLASSAAAVYCWSNTGIPRRRGLAMAGLWSAIAFALASHWYGFIILFPLAAGQSARDIIRRRLDFKVWLVLVTASLTVSINLPLLKAASQYRFLPWKGVVYGDAVQTMVDILQPIVTPLVFVGVAVAAAQFVFGQLRKNDVELLCWPKPEVVCVLALALLPVIGLVPAKLITHSYVPRYFLPAALGMISLICILLRAVCRNNSRVMALAVAVLCCYLCPKLLRTGLSYTHHNAGQFSEAAVFSQFADAPIVISSMHLFVPMEEHATPRLRKRLLYVSDPASVAVLNQDTTFRGSEAAKLWTNLPIIDLRTLTESNLRYYVVGNITGGDEWLLFRLAEDHSQITLLGNYQGSPAYLVTAD